MSGSIRAEKDGHVGRIVIDHAARRNALTRAMWKAIPEAVAALDRDPEVRVVILRGAGEEAFVSGADISEFEEVRQGPGARDYDADTSAAFEALRAMDKPVIALLHGYCIGGGAALALSADLRYAADDVELAIPPARLGLGYAVANVESLARVVGTANAREVLFTARRYSATEALGIGWVHRVFPKAELDAAVAKIARQIADNAPLTVRSAKTVLRELDRPESARDHQRMEASVLACIESEDYREGVRAFLEKRKPRFVGK
jgi:enoyl-CoA hydratase/carnithine racemase